jgi:outer membrane lipase/esterase
LSAGDRNGTTREEGFEFTSTGLTLGLDYRRNDGWVLGAALGLSSTTSDFDSGGDLEAVGTFATFFASRQLSRFYIEGGATVGISAFDQARKIQYTLSDGTAVDQAVSASFDGSEYSLFFNTGTELLLPRQLSITPRARIELIQLDVDGFTEDTVSASGDAGDGWRTRIDAQNSRSFLVGLGAQISWIRNRENAVWVPYGALEWVQDFDAEKSNVSGQFVGDPTGETFVFVSDSPDDSYYKLNLGTSVLFTGGRSAFIDYSNLLSIKHNSVHSFNLGFRWEY